MRCSACMRPLNGRQPPGNVETHWRLAGKEQKRVPWVCQKVAESGLQWLDKSLKATSRLMDGSTPEQTLALRCALWSRLSEAKKKRTRVLDVPTYMSVSERRFPLQLCW